MGPRHCYCLLLHTTPSQPCRCSMSLSSICFVTGVTETREQELFSSTKLFASFTSLECILYFWDRRLQAPGNRMLTTLSGSTSVASKLLARLFAARRPASPHSGHKAFHCREIFELCCCLFQREHVCPREDATRTQPKDFAIILWPSPLF